MMRQQPPPPSGASPRVALPSATIPCLSTVRVCGNDVPSLHTAASPAESNPPSFVMLLRQQPGDGGDESLAMAGTASQNPPPPSRRQAPPLYRVTSIPLDAYRREARHMMEMQDAAARHPCPCAGAGRPAFASLPKTRPRAETVKNGAPDSRHRCEYDDLDEDDDGGGDHIGGPEEDKERWHGETGAKKATAATSSAIRWAGGLLLAPWRWALSSSCCLFLGLFRGRRPTPHAQSQSV